MNKAILYFSIVIGLATTSHSLEKPTVDSTKRPALEKAADATSREHNFEDLLVQGKYHFSDEAVTTVEEDKVLDSLLGTRADFKDRMSKSAGQY